MLSFCYKTTKKFTICRKYSNTLMVCVTYKYVAIVITCDRSTLHIVSVSTIYYVFYAPQKFSK